MEIFWLGNVKTLERPYDSIQIYPADILFSGRVGATYIGTWRVWQVIRDFQPDVIHVEQEVFSLSALEVAFFARWFRKPLSVFGWENMQRQLAVPRQWIRQFIFDTAELVIPGNQDGKALMNQWGYTGKVEVVPQIGVDTTLFPPRVRQLGDGPLKVGFMGRLVKQKGIDLMLLAAQKLHEQGCDIQLIICGSGIESETLQQEAGAKGISDQVIWRSNITHKQVPAEMDRFDVLVLPSRTTSTWKEQFGHVLIEAMSMGIPAIGSDSGEIPNVIGNPDLVFPEGDAEALARILKHIVTDSAWYKDLSQQCIARVEKYYSHARIAQRLIDLWRAMLI